MWNEMPGFEEVREAYLKRARLTGGIRVLELRLQMAEAEVSLRKPRNTAIRFLGDDQNSEEVQQLRQELTALRIELDEAEAEIRLLEYHKDVYKSLSYANRI